MFLLIKVLSPYIVTTMSRLEKILEKARNNPGGLRFGELKTLMGLCGWTFDHQKGSHEIWYSPGEERLPIQSKNGKAKEYQVKQFLAVYDGENNES